MARTFLALELPAAARQALATQARRLSAALPDIRWVDVAGIHLTLAFLGELDDPALAAALASAEQAAAATRPFDLALGGLGLFGSAMAPRVVWAGVGGDLDALRALHARLADTLAARGFAREARPFSPHLTLARLKPPVDPAVARRLQALAQPQVGPPLARWQAAALSAMRSELAREGARYTCLRAYRFAG